jgi:hypothetical protein
MGLSVVFDWAINGSGVKTHAAITVAQNFV